jgi:hypothetical protein
MKNLEGECSFHARTCESDEAMFIQTSNGKIIIIENERSCPRTSPYMNKFGETFNDKSKKWDNFYMDSTSGGNLIYEGYKKMYMNFNVANEIIKNRSMQDTVFRVRAL